MRRTLPLLLLLGLTACASEPLYGSGDVTLSLDVAKAYRAYARGERPGSFAVSTDGKAWGASSCPTVRCRPSSAYLPAIEQCETRSNGVPCQVLADGYKVVWKGHVNLPEGVIRPPDGLRAP